MFFIQGVLWKFSERFTFLHIDFYVHSIVITVEDPSLSRIAYIVFLKIFCFILANSKLGLLYLFHIYFKNQITGSLKQIKEISFFSTTFFPVILSSCAKKRLYFLKENTQSTHPLVWLDIQISVSSIIDKSTLLRTTRW